MHRLDPSFGTSNVAGELPRPADQPPSAVRRASAILAEQPLVVFCAVLVASLTACLALLASDAFRGASIFLNQMIGATKVVVFLDAHAPSQTVESIGARLKAIPGVSGASLKTKEDAFSAVEAAPMGTLLASKEISLPDAWVLSLRTQIHDGADDPRSLSAEVQRLQEMAGKLNGVQSIRFDRVWVGELDRWFSWFRNVTVMVSICLSGVLALLLIATFYLCLRALRVKQCIDMQRKFLLRIGVFAYIGLFVVALSGVFAFLLHELATFGLSKFFAYMPSPMQPWMTAFGQSRSRDMLIVAATMFVAATVGTLLASRHRETV